MLATLYNHLLCILFQYCVYKQPFFVFALLTICLPFGSLLNEVLARLIWVIAHSCSRFVKDVVVSNYKKYVIFLSVDWDALV